MPAQRTTSLLIVVATGAVAVGLLACDPPPPKSIDPGPTDGQLDARPSSPAPAPASASPSSASAAGDMPKTDGPVVPAAGEKAAGQKGGPPIPEGPADVAGVEAALLGTWDAEVRLVKGSAHQRLVFQKGGTFQQEDSGGDKGTRTRAGRFIVVGGNPQKFQMELGFDGSQLKSSSSWGFDKEGKLFTQVRQDSPVVYTRTKLDAPAANPTPTTPPMTPPTPTPTPTPPTK